MNPEFLETWTPRALAVLRIVVAFLFIQHGTGKLLGVPNIGMPGPPPLLSLMGVAGILEIAGSLLILMGWFTRPAAFILCGEMAVAYFMAHASQGHFVAPMLNQGESAVLFCFVFLFLSLAGPGAWGIDKQPK